MKSQSCHPIETSEWILRVNQLSVTMVVTSAFNELNSTLY